MFGSRSQRSKTETSVWRYRTQSSGYEKKIASAKKNPLSSISKWLVVVVGGGGGGGGHAL